MTRERVAAHDWLAREIIDTPTFAALPVKEQDFVVSATAFPRLSPAQWKWLADIAAKVQQFGYLQGSDPNAE